MQSKIDDISKIIKEQIRNYESQTKQDEIGYVILKVEKEDGEDILVTIDDEAEFDHIADKFDEMLNDEIDYDE